jgi:hypothetical protein
MPHAHLDDARCPMPTWTMPHAPFPIPDYPFPIPRSESITIHEVNGSSNLACRLIKEVYD